MHTPFSLSSSQERGERGARERVEEGEFESLPILRGSERESKTTASRSRNGA